MQSETFSPEQIEILRHKVKGSLYAFAKGVLGYDWLTPEIHLPICNALEDYEINKRLKAVLPRGWLKTTLCSIAYPIWRAVRNREIRILIVQNTYSNATSKLMAIRSQVKENKILRGLFPEIIPTKNSVDRTDSFCINRSKNYPESTFEAAGIRTQVTSRHYNLIIEDDTVAPDLDDLGEDNVAPRKDDIVQAIGWHRLASPLLTNPSDDQLLVVGTRWFEKDLMSWIDKNEKNYLKIERSCRENEKGEPDHNGKITYPERFNESVLAELEVAMGPYMFSCLYLNTPVRSEDMLFKGSWIQYYDTPPRGLISYTTVDPATDPEESAKGVNTDFSVVLTCGKDLRTGKIYVLDYFQKKCTPGEIIAAVFDHVRRFKPVIVGYESVAFQKSLGYWLRERMRAENTFFMLKKLTHAGRRSKGDRISALQPVFASHAIYLRTFMTALEAELLAFPLAPHDDVIDALAMQLEVWQVTSSKEQHRRSEEPDPMSIDGAIHELRERGKERSRFSPIYDLIEQPSALDFSTIAR